MKIKKQQFGGEWTDRKLICLRKYLSAYTTIMKEYKYSYAYIDAFAGTGYRVLKEKDNSVLTQMELFPSHVESKSTGLVDGSARIALQVDPQFDKYIFIEKSSKKIAELKKIKTEFNNLADKIVICHGDANKYLYDLCKKNWQKHRAVIFLDPFGMQVPWSTIKLIAQTNAIDLWYLFPVGVAVNRLLKKDGNIHQSRQKRLNEIFGSEDWYNVFYEANINQDLFGQSISKRKKANFQLIANYFINRLSSIFEGVAENPLWLTNSFNTPLYLLCFAAANKKGAKTAIKIAQHILRD